MSEIKRNRHVFQKYEIYLLMALLILSSLLRIYRLDHQSYWTDEIITIKAAKQSAAQLLFHPTITNNAPPLYFLMSHFLLQLNQRNAELMLRLPSALFGILSVALFYLVVRKLLGKRMGFMASMLMALSPFHIWYSQEARPYALLLFLSLLSLWLFQELISKPQNQWLKAAFLGSVALTFYCHTIAISFIGALFSYILLFYFKTNRLYWLKIFIAIIILIIPALFYLMINPPASGGDPHRSTKIFTSIAYTIWTFSTGFSLGPSLTEWHAQDKLKILLSCLHLILPIMVLVSSLLGLGVIKLYKNYKQAFWISLLLFTCPLFFAILGSMISPVHPFNVRYSILSFPAFIIFIAIGLLSIKNYLIRLIASSLLIGLCVLSLNNYYFNQKYHREDNRGSGLFLKTHAHSNDLVICSAGYTASNLRYYCPSEDIKFISYPSKYQFVDPTQLKSDFNGIIDQRDRFWLFLSRTFHSDPKGHIFKYCIENFKIQNSYESTGVKLICFVKATEIE